MNTPTLTATDLRTIRQRLGWSMAEMARRMGGDVALINAWETGEQTPAADVLNQFHFLLNHLDWTSTQVAQAPVAETRMESDGLAQLTHRDLLKDL